MIKLRHSVKTNRLAVGLAQGAGNAPAQTVVITVPAPAVVAPAVISDADVYYPSLF